MIYDNLIYNGRGAGIGMTWNSEASVRNNVIHHYWKGIGSFGTAWTHVSHNLVRDVRGWGIIASGESSMYCSFNEVRRCGNVGIAVWDSTATMDITDNVISQCGQEKQWVAPLVGIWVNAPDSLFSIRNNLFWGNKQADIAYGYKEPGLDGSAFTFDHSVEKFNNYTFIPTVTLNNSNYFKPDYHEPVYSSCMQLISTPQTGIFAKRVNYPPWTWNPDGEPFEK
jgi:hypothetical protein